MDQPPCPEPTTPPPPWLEALVAVSYRAGAALMSIYATDFAVYAKQDASPVTVADEQAEAIVVAALRVLTPEIPIVAEESVAKHGAPVVGEHFWLVDALDGTREFVQRNGEFTVNVALVEHGRVVLGVVHAPAIGRLYAGAAGWGAFVEEANVRRPIRCRDAPAHGVTVLASRSHGSPERLETYLQQRKVATRTNAGSSLKLCLIAAGEADLYPRFGPTMEWDIAAGQAVLEAAGGSVMTLEGAPLGYGKPAFRNPDFVAEGPCG